MKATIIGLEGFLEAKLYLKGSRPLFRFNDIRSSMIALAILSKIVGADWATLENQVRVLPSNWDALYTRRRSVREPNGAEDQISSDPRKSGGGGPSFSRQMDIPWGSTRVFPREVNPSRRKHSPTGSLYSENLRSQRIASIRRER